MTVERPQHLDEVPLTPPEAVVRQYKTALRDRDRIFFNDFSGSRVGNWANMFFRIFTDWSRMPSSVYNSAMKEPDILRSRATAYSRDHLDELRKLAARDMEEDFRKKGQTGQHYRK